METNGMVANRDEILHCCGVGEIEVGCRGESIDGTWKGIRCIWCQSVSARRAEEIGWSTKHSQLGPGAC